MDLQPNGPFKFGQRAILLAKHLKRIYGPKGYDDFSVQMMCEAYIAAAERGNLLQYLVDTFQIQDNLEQMEIINAMQKAMRGEEPEEDAGGTSPGPTLP